MTSDERSRKPTDHGEVVGFCLQVAATNSALLTRQSSGRSGWHMDLNPLANGIRRNVADALKAAAQHVDMFAENTARDFGRELTEEQEAAKGRTVRSLARDLDALAQRAGHQTIALSEFENIRVRLMDQGLVLGPHHALDVVAAIMNSDP